MSRRSCSPRWPRPELSGGSSQRLARVRKFPCATLALSFSCPSATLPLPVRCPLTALVRSFTVLFVMVPCQKPGNKAAALSALLTGKRTLVTNTCHRLRTALSLSLRAFSPPASPLNTAGGRRAINSRPGLASRPRPALGQHAAPVGLRVPAGWPGSRVHAGWPGGAHSPGPPG